jgi:hypothetical protein
MIPRTGIRDWIWEKSDSVYGFLLLLDEPSSLAVRFRLPGAALGRLSSPSTVWIFLCPGPSVFLADTRYYTAPPLNRVDNRPRPDSRGE